MAQNHWMKERRLPGILIVAVLLVLGISYIFISAQSVSAEEDVSIQYIWVDQDGEPIPTDGENNDKFIYSDGLSDGSRNLKIEVTGATDEMVIEKPTICYGNSDTPCLEEAGYSYDPEKRTFSFIGAELYESTKKENTTFLTIYQSVKDGSGEVIKWLWYTVYPAEPYMTTPMNWDFLFVYDSKVLPREIQIYDDDEFVFRARDSVHRSEQELTAVMTDLEVIEQHPTDPNKDVAVVHKDDGSILLDLMNPGTVTLKAAFRDEMGDTRDWKYELTVAEDTFDASINSKNGETTALPGEEITLKANVTHQTGDGYEPLGEIQYEWFMENGDDCNDGYSPEYFFEIQDQGSEGPSIRFKSRDEIRDAFPDADDEELLKMMNRSVEVGLRVLRNDDEVAESSDKICLSMSTEFYQIGDPNNRSFLLDVSARKTDYFDSTLYRITLDTDGKRAMETIDSQDVTLKLDDYSNEEGVGMTGSGTKTQFAFPKGFGSENKSFEITISAEMKDAPGDTAEVAYADHKIVFFTTDLDLYDISMWRQENTKYFVDDNNKNIDLDVLGVAVKYGDYILPEDKYILKIYRVDEDGEPAQEIDPSQGIGVHELDKDKGYTDYVIEAKARKNSGFTGASDYGYFTVWNRFQLSNETGDLYLDQEKAESEGSGFGDDADYEFSRYDEYWEGFEKEIGYDRFHFDGTKEVIRAELTDGTELIRDRDYEVTYYQRNIKEDNIEKKLGKQLPGFPTEPGTYIMKLTGKAPYTGSMYYAFDLTISLEEATVSGIAKKTYTGKHRRQDMKKIKVTLGETTLRDGWDYDVIYDNNIKPGKAKMCIEGSGKYHGKIIKTFVIDKAKNTMIVKGKTYKISYKKLKKKNRKIAVKKAYKIKKKKGKLTFKKYKGNKRILVSKNGRITVKKGLKKGKYKIKVKVTASGNSCYKKITKIATVTIKVR